MREDGYDKNYQEREYDKYSQLDPKRQKKKPSVLTIILVGLLVLLVCSLSYDNIVKPYLEKRKQQAESSIASTPQESEETATSETDEITSIDNDASVSDIIEEPVQIDNPVSTDKAITQTPPASTQSNNASSG